MITRFDYNPALPTLAPASYQGVPVDEKGRFVNLQYPFEASFREVWKWQTSRNPHREFKKKDTWRIPVISNASALETQDDCLVWLGHASWYLHLNGFRILIDPVLGDLNRLVRRKAPFPIDPSRLGSMDYILVSHDHRDHCDAKSIRWLSRLNPQAQWLTGLRLNTLLQKWTGSNAIQAAGWYQQYDTDTSGIEIFYLPTRHWSRRGLNDTNATLWGAFLLRANGKTIYFGGDTGESSHFEDYKTLFGAPDIFMGGVGAYQPEWFMHPSHMSPASAVAAAKTLGAGTFIPMHYGVFDLSDEPIGYPQLVLEELQQEDDFLKERLKVLKVGEIWRV